MKSILNFLLFIILLFLPKSIFSEEICFSKTIFHSRGSLHSKNFHNPNDNKINECYFTLNHSSKSENTINFFILIAGGLGINKNHDLIWYAYELAENYRVHLERTYGLIGFHTQKPITEKSFDINIGTEIRLFIDSGFGIGIHFGLCAPIFQPISITNPENEGALKITPYALFLYTIPSIQYKFYFDTYHQMKFYILIGSGLGIVYGKVKFIINEGYSNDNIGTPDASLFENSYQGNAAGFMGTLEIGVEENNLMLLTGIRIRYAKISSLSNEKESLHLENGLKAQLIFNGAFIYAGIGISI